MDEIEIYEKYFDGLPNTGTCHLQPKCEYDAAPELVLEEFSDVKPAMSMLAKVSKKKALIKGNILNAKKRETLINENQNLQKIVEALQNQLHNAVADNQKLIQNYDEIIKYYSNVFDYKINIISSHGDIFKVEIDFIFNGIHRNFPIVFELNSHSKDLIDFDVSSFCGEEESKMYKTWFETNHNLPGLVCKLRTHLFTYLQQI